jgi:class 3 adenylate cyclase
MPRIRRGSRAEGPTADLGLSSEQLAAISRFPDANPNPVLRISGDGRLIYANPASAPILEAWAVALGELIPVAVLEALEEAAPDHGFVEVGWAGRTYAVWPIRIGDLGFTNLYGTDVTAERAIVKFPDQNPNPVIRIDWDGVLVYANPASGGLVGGLGAAVGRPLPAELRQELLERARLGAPAPLEVETGGRAYALTPIDIPGFGFINVYGTDITAVRERERLARENERLLLNILPEPIARRLREGEPLIADRFEDVTLLFADIVGFTNLSSDLSAHELVRMLNDVFTVFDGFVERYGLEKVKTIGDAYMVVGGLTETSNDHTGRVASMALDLDAAVRGIKAATRHAITFRMGLHAGPVVAGVIGTKKFIYDVWGDTVNVASRMESFGVPGRIQVTETIVERLGGNFRFEPRGLVEIKGKGPTPTWFLTGRADDGLEA